MTGSIWTDMLLFVAFIGLLSIGMFRLDTIISAPRRKAGKPEKKFCASDPSGKIVLLDPDGRRSRPKRRI